jgi:hypothetical protein
MNMSEYDIQYDRWAPEDQSTVLYFISDLENRIKVQDSRGASPAMILMMIEDFLHDTKAKIYGKSYEDRIQKTRRDQETTSS